MFKNAVKFIILAGAFLSLGAWMMPAAMVATSLFGGSQAGNAAGGAPTGYVPTGLPTANQAWLQALQQLQQGAGQAQQVSPYLQGSFQNMMNVPTQGMVQAGQQAGQQYGNLAGLAGQYSGQLGQASQMDAATMQALLGAGGQMWNQATAAANNQPLQQYMQGLVGQNAALANAMYGLQGPQAAGNVSDALNKFSMQWPEYQLGLMGQGMQGYGQAANAATNIGNLAGRNVSAAYDLASQVPSSTLAAGQTPVSTAYSAYGMPMQGANQYLQGLGSMMQPYGNIQSSTIPFMNYGAGAINQNYGNAAYGQNYQNQQLATNMQGLATGLGGLQNYFSGNQASGIPVNMGAGTIYDTSGYLAGVPGIA